MPSLVFYGRREVQWLATEADAARFLGVPTPAFLDVHPATILPAVVKKMFKNGLHHVFVTEGDKKKVTGVITTFDVLMVMNRVLNPEN